MIEGAWLIMNDCEQLASYLWSETDENEIIGNVYENRELLRIRNETKRYPFSGAKKRVKLRRYR